jgi:hypothetical protein
VKFNKFTPLCWCGGAIIESFVTTDDHFCHLTFRYHRQAKKRQTLTNRQTEYVKNLPKSRQQLLKVGRIRRSCTKNEFYALLMHTLMTGGNLNCGTDGGLKINRGTFGLVVSIEDKIVWEGCGPVDGNPDTASSKRSELAMQAFLTERNSSCLVGILNQSTMDCNPM